jgi:peptidoglycan/xylan/chitin deacetylase (PgdA/CDA1 family)
MIFNIFFIFAAVLTQPEQSDTLAFFHGSRSEKFIALTFDACPTAFHGGYDERIVKTLIDSGVPATFFLSGRWIARHRQQTKSLASVSGFELANHSYSHPHCTTMSDDSVKRELQRTESLIKSIAGFSVHLFRPPYCETDGRIEGIAHDLGLTTVMHDLASGDPDSTITLERLIRHVVSKAKNGSIIVMHINGRGVHTAEALPEIIHALREKKFVFVKVSDLLKANNRSDVLPVKDKKP